MKDKEFEEYFRKVKEDVQNIIDCYEKDIKYIERLEKENQQSKEELQKSDSITQSCIFQGKEESTINFRKCLKQLDLYKSVIDEVTGLIEKHKFAYINPLTQNIYNVSKCDDLLKILDKVNKENK